MQLGLGVEAKDLKKVKVNAAVYMIRKKYGTYSSGSVTSKFTQFRTLKRNLLTFVPQS